MESFRFENMIIWQDAISVSDMLFDYADKAEDKRFYKFAEQLRAATMSISNNIAEGSGSFSDKEFASFLNISRRSVFECANILQIFLRRKIISGEEKITIYLQLEILSKKITNFRKALKTKCFLPPAPCSLPPAPCRYQTAKNHS
jgi:four helix bundle protein